MFSSPQLMQSTSVMIMSLAILAGAFDHCVAVLFSRHIISTTFMCSLSHGCGKFVEESTNVGGWGSALAIKGCSHYLTIKPLNLNQVFHNPKDFMGSEH